MAAEGETRAESRDGQPVIEALDALHHGVFGVLMPQARKSLGVFIAITTHHKKVGEFTVQYYLDDDKAKLAGPEWVSWTALLFDFVVDDEGRLIVQGKEVIPQQPGVIEVTDMPELSERPTHVTQWPGDINYALVQAWRLGHDLHSEQG